MCAFKKMFTSYPITSFNVHSQCLTAPGGQDCSFGHKIKDSQCLKYLSCSRKLWFSLSTFSGCQNQCTSQSETPRDFTPPWQIPSEGKAWHFPSLVLSANPPLGLFWCLVLALCTRGAKFPPGTEACQGQIGSLEALQLNLHEQSWLQVFSKH